ncbi:MAG TPA: PAS domain S-box protein [Vicinamibacteria bacterium]
MIPPNPSARGLHRAFFEAVPQPVIVVACDTSVVLAVNAAALRQYGYTPEEFTRLTLAELRAPDAPPWPSGADAGEPAALVELHRRRDGSLFPAEVIAGALDFGGRAARVAIVADVTERRRAEDGLRASEGRFRALLENTSDGVLLVARDGTVLYRSQSAARILGYTPTERVGAGAMDLIHPEDRPAAREALGRALATPGEPIALEVRAVHETRAVVRLDCVLVNRLEEPAVRAVVVNYRDVTEARQAQEALSDSERRFRALVENSSDFITLLDRSGVTLYASPPITRVLGYEPLECVGRPARELLHPDDVARTAAVFTACLARPGVTITAQYRCRHKDGTWRTLESSSVNRFDEPGVEALVTNTRDVTEIHRLEEQFRQVQKMDAVGRLAGGVAHDFNNLLTAILGYGDLLQRDLPQGARGRRHLDELRKAAECAATLTRQLLAFSRKQVLVPAVIDLGAVVADLADMLRRLIGEDIVLSTRIHAPVGKVRADRGQVEQAILNLAVNARDAMPSGGGLTLEVQDDDVDGAVPRAHPDVPPGRYVRLTVSDTGTGMDAETRSRVFEPFFTTKPPGVGTGLGLSIVYGVVKQSGGHIAVCSEPGRGTTFQLYLPRLDAGAPPG